MELKNFFTRLRHSKKVSVLLWALGEIILVFLVFHAGVSYGERRVFHRGLMSQTRNMHEFGFWSHSFIPQGHGVVGVITKVTLPQITIQTREGSTEVVTVGTSTLIRENSILSAPENLKVGVPVMVLGEPENTTEQFTASFITILPPPQQ